MRTIAVAAAVAAGAAAAYASYRALRRDAKLKASPKVRDAGPANMSAPPQRWDKRDEALDESFPASDPPSTY